MKRISNGNFIFIIFLVIMAWNAFESRGDVSILEWLKDTLYILPAIVIGITIHEFAHAYSAWKLGDDTPKLQGRVTLNPIKHIDPVGIIALIFVHFGWGKPVQVNPYAFKNNRRACNLIVDVAGVITNFVCAFVVVGIFMSLINSGVLPGEIEYIKTGVMIGNVDYILAGFLTGGGVVSVILFYIIWINIVLMVFNLLPIPPLDGFGIITEIFDLRRFKWYQTFYSNGSLILLILILFGITSGLLTPALDAIITFMSKIWSSILL